MKNTFFLAMMAITCTSLMSGCSNSDDPTPTPTPTGGAGYQVEYRISSTTATTATYFVYTNETGGKTTVPKLTLPGSITFKRAMKTGEYVSFVAALPDNSPANSDITGVILLDGKEVARSTGRGVEATANVVYVVQ